MLPSGSGPKTSAGAPTFFWPCSSPHGPLVLRQPTNIAGLTDDEPQRLLSVSGSPLTRLLLLTLAGRANAGLTESYILQVDEQGRPATPEPRNTYRAPDGSDEPDRVKEAAKSAIARTATIRDRIVDGSLSTIPLKARKSGPFVPTFSPRRRPWARSGHVLSGFVVDVLAPVCG